MSGNADLTVATVLAPSLRTVIEEGEGFKPEEGVLQGQLKNLEALMNLETLLSHLPLSQQTDLLELINGYAALFSDVPSCADWTEHDIEVGDVKPVKQHFYLVSPEKRS